MRIASVVGDRSEVLRYGINGLVATAVHFAVLTINVDVLLIPSAALANTIAACFGVTASFIGSRYFVFRKRSGPLLRQAAQFSGLYVLIAALHGTVLFFWTDLYHLDYRTGFVLATVIQVMCSYWGNKMVVFKS
ncbi:MAG: GtrA family protein [Gammaproteobacteria bacterium]|nr:GtrA family protein [Gammaproteobacteria bacterium]